MVMGPGADPPGAGPAHGPAEPASASCEHFWAHHVRGGSKISVRMCGFCGLIDWDDLDEQAAAIVAAERERIRQLVLAETAGVPP